MHFVPRSSDVLYHTALLEPQKSETIYFEAPTTPGEYTVHLQLSRALGDDDGHDARALTRERRMHDDMGLADRSASPMSLRRALSVRACP